MKRTIRAAAAGCLAVLGGIAWLAGSGCETMESRGSALVMTPATTNLTDAGATVVFSLAFDGMLLSAADGDTNSPSASTPPLLLPIAWSVSDTGLGTVRSTGDGMTAIYERRGVSVGNNYVYARDRVGRYEAVGMVRQAAPYAGGTLAVNPASSTLTEPFQTVVLVAERPAETTETAAAMLPLRWTVSNPRLGGIRSTGSMTAIYERNGETIGNNFITVRDESGLFTGTAVINQREAGEEPPVETVEENGIPVD